MPLEGVTDVVAHREGVTDVVAEEMVDSLARGAGNCGISEFWGVVAEEWGYSSATCVFGSSWSRYTLVLVVVG